MVFWFFWSLQVFVFGVMAITFPYRDGRGSDFLSERLYVLGLGIKPFARWKIIIAVCFLWLGPWGVAHILEQV